jgi:8-oxo-dGTP pyrophosphatase MutT (NUDIX family)
MAREFSAGVVLFRNHPHRQYLILDYGSHWDFPKGHIKTGEDSHTAAMRELLEETGIRDARLVPGFKESMRYFYRKGGERILKSVVYFVAETSSRQVTLSHEHTGYAWVPFEEALGRLTYPTAREMLTKAHAFLGARDSGAG